MESSTAALPSRPRTPADHRNVTTPNVNNNSNNNNINNINNSTAKPAQATRRSSLGFLRRSKSTEQVSERKSSAKVSRKMLKEQAREEELRRRREAAAVSKHAPRLPDLSPPPLLNSFGGEDSVRPSGYQPSTRPGIAMDVPPVPPLPAGVRDRDPYAGMDSMTHRGRYSYASSAMSTLNSPRRVRRRKDPTPYNVLVVGSKNCGKTSFVEFLRSSMALPPSKRPTKAFDEPEARPGSSGSVPFTSHYIETEIDNERIGLTLWDSEGLQKNIVDLQLRDITSFLESKFEDTFAEEMKVIRAPGVRDTHIHCAFFILDPARLDANIDAAKKAISRGKPSSSIIGGLDTELDIQVMRTMQGKTTVIPIISKADTITSAHMAFLKRSVWNSLKQANIDPLEILSLDELGDAVSDDFDENDEDDILREMDVHASPARDELESPDLEPIRTRSRSRSPGLSSAFDVEQAIDYPFPLSILSPDPHTLNNKTEKVGRRFPWGFADPYDPEHCDFVKLKENVFGEWRGDLREASREVWYERWRTTRLNRHAYSANGGRVTR